MTMTTNTDISIKNFFIYNVSFGQIEGHEEEKIMYFYPRGTSLDSQMMDIGLSEAIVKFTETFSSDLCDALQTLKTKKFFFKPEENFWAIMTVNLPTRLVSKERLDGIEYLPNDVQNPVYLAVLRQAYLAAKMFIGPFQRVIDKDNGSSDLLKKKLDSFFTKYILTLDLKKCDIIDLFQGVQFLPLDKPTFLHAQCFVNLVGATFPIVDFSLLLYNEQLVWSGLPADDAQVVYRYLVNSLLPVFLSSTLASDGRRTVPKPNRFVTGPENLTDIDVTYSGKVPRVYLSHVNNPGFYHLIVYRHHQATLCLLIQGHESVKLDFYKRLDSFLTRRLGKIGSELGEYKEQQVGSSSSSDTYEQETRYVYFNSMNLATKSTLDKKKDHTGQSVSKELLRLLVEVQQHQMWASVFRNGFIGWVRTMEGVCVCHPLLPRIVKIDHTELSTLSFKLPVTEFHLQKKLAENGCLSNETFLKTMSDHWVVGKMSNSRQFYVTVERKKAGLVDVSEDVRKLCDKQLNSIFFHV